ncbi:hypothetical protein JCM25156A_15910 [Komagataeibacter kakiaceti JCM 25156]
METQPIPVPAGQAGTIQASARLIRLEAGTYCLFHATAPVAAATGGVSGMRISAPPGMTHVRVSTFDADGWIGARNGAALVRVPDDGGAVLVTTYRDGMEGCDLPGVQVVRLSGPAVRADSPAPAPPDAKPVVVDGEGGMTAHIQRRGDIRAAPGEWMGARGSGQWVEGFAIHPPEGIAARDLEYQAILGRDWFSPWMEGGAYCGSRGMALPVLGLRVRLKGAAARTFLCHVEASFTDGTHLGPVEDAPVVAPDLPPLEAFRIHIQPRAIDPPPDATMEEVTPPPAPRARRPRRVVPARMAGPQGEAVTDGPAPWWRRKRRQAAGEATSTPARRRASRPTQS